MRPASAEEFIKRKQEMAAERGTFVVRGNTLDSRWFINNLREYDRLMRWVRDRIGRNIDTPKALELLEKSRAMEEAFREFVQELNKFVSQHAEKPKSNGSGSGSGSSSGKVKAMPTDTITEPTEATETAHEEKKSRKRSKEEEPVMAQ